MFRTTHTFLVRCWKANLHLTFTWDVTNQFGKQFYTTEANTIMLHTSRNRTLHKNRLLDSFKDLKGTNAALYLQGSKHTTKNPTTDVDAYFRQESSFYWVTGCNEADCAVLINLADSKTHLLIPELDDEYALWCGDYPVESDYKSILGVDEVVFNKPENIKKLVADLKIEKVFTLNHIAEDLKKVADNVEIDNSRLYDDMRELRMVKTQDEIEEMRQIAKISVDAHHAVMRHAHAGMNESEADAVYTYHCHLAGAPRLAYPAIVAGDDRGATLHYVNNNKIIKDGSLLLIDAGGELATNWGSDITRTYPVNGKFTKEQKEIYEIVLKANKEVIEKMKPGVEWVDMHRHATRIIIEGLHGLGLLVADSVKELEDNHIGGYFMPHGIGHALGLDTHDPPNRDGSFAAIDAPGIRFLRVNRALKEGYYMTVEPGCYFIPRLLKKAFADEKIAKYFNREKLEQYMHFGGVRIEDNVVVTANGAENLTAQCIKEVADLEKVIGTSAREH